MNIVITGASKGIGKAIAEKFAANGYSLFLCVRNEDQLARTSEAISAKNSSVQVRYKTCDESRKEDLKSFASWIIEYSENVDVVVNNAGSFVPGHVYEEDDGLIEYLITTKLYSAYYLSKYLLPGMIQRKQGHISNICSIAALKAYGHGG